MRVAVGIRAVPAGFDVADGERLVVPVALGDDQCFVPRFALSSFGFARFVPGSFLATGLLSRRFLCPSTRFLSRRSVNSRW
jgi:hypothetical protein